MGRFTRLGLIGVVSVALWSGGGALSGVTLASASTSAPAGNVQRFFDGINNAVPADIGSIATQYQMFVLSAWDWPDIATIKAANPSAKVLVYKDLLVTESGQCTNGVDDSDLSGGVGYCAAQPDWFLTDASGQRMQFSDYPGDWEMDVGSPGYQQAWLKNVEGVVQAHGWDGVYMDDANTRCNDHGPCSAQYPTDAALQAAMFSMLSAVSPPLQAQGTLTIANIAGAFAVPGLWANWLSVLSGASQEWFVNWSDTYGTGYVWDWPGTSWKSMVDELTTASRMGKIVLANGGGVPGDWHAVLYDTASFLLGTDGRSYFSYERDTGTYPEYGWKLGAPSGPYSAIAGLTSVYQRQFAGGMVMVNASQDTPATIALPSTYLTTWGQPVTSVYLSGQEATILRSP